jgi:hypothetical protein
MLKLKYLFLFRFIFLNLDNVDWAQEKFCLKLVYIVNFGNKHFFFFELLFDRLLI